MGVEWDKMFSRHEAFLISSSMETAAYGKRDFLRPTLVLIEERKEDILREWLERGQTERASCVTGETAEEIGRDFLSAVISDIGTAA